MDDLGNGASAPGEDGPKAATPAASLRELVERALLVGVDALTTTKEHAGDVVGASRELGALRDRASGTLATLFASLGFAKQESYEQLELKVAQLEHRLGLLEEREDASAG
jgi:hypothetical protein